MKRFVSACVIVLFLFISAAPLFAKEFLSIAKITKQAKTTTSAKYPNSDSAVIDDVIQVRYRPDGTSETWDDTAIKILTEKGKRNNQTLTLTFNASYGTNSFTKVQIIKPDGSVHAVDIKTNSKVMIDPGQMGENIYNPNSKVLMLSVPGLEVGDTLHYIAHDVETKTVVPNTWSDYQVFESTFPIEHTRYQVIAPISRPLKKIVLKSKVPGTVTFSKKVNGQDDTIVYTWDVRHVPRMFGEPNMPPSYTVVQRLLVSTIDKWQDISKWYWNLSKPHLAATTPAMKAKAQELIAGCTTEMEKIKAIFDFVAQDIRYLGITTEKEEPGYEPHDVKITFANRFGVCRDKAALLAAMLRLVHIKAFPVILMVGPKKNGEVPQPYFNHAVTAALDKNGNYILMDSTAENTKDIFPAYLQNMSYLVARPKGDTLRTTPVIPAKDNLLKIHTTGTLDEDGDLDAKSTLVFEGINDTIYRGYFSRIKPEQRRRFFEGQLKKSLPTAELLSIRIRPQKMSDTTRPLTVTLSYTAAKLLIYGSENKMLDLPWLSGSLGYVNFLIGRTGLQERKYPLYTRMTAGISETIDLQMPDNLGTVNLPHYKDIDSKPLTWNMQVNRHDGKISATNTFLLNTVQFSPKQYLDLKQDLSDIQYNMRKSLVFDNPSFIAASVNSDIRVLNQTTRIVLEGSDRWTQTEHSRIKILTPAGQKEYSEIKIPFNPAWQDVTLTQASVTLPDGTVKKIAGDEINLMDAPWVASAPRYPAGKILVASLPGVEVGSVLDFTTVSKVHGKPFFSDIEAFNSFEPVNQKTVSITVPASLSLNIHNTGIADTRTAGNGTVTYTWTASNQPPIKEEEALPAWWTFNPTVFVSTGDWKTYGHEVLARLQAACRDQAVTENIAQKLTTALSGRLKKVTALRDWVAENLLAAGPDLTSLPLSAISPADQTLKDGYGNSTDRMVVLYVMLKSAGFDPEFILSGNIPLVPEAARPLISIPLRTAFTTVLIKLNVAGETIYLDGATQYAELGTSSYNHRIMLDLRDGSIGTIQVPTGKENHNRRIYTMDIASDGKVRLTSRSLITGTTYEDFHKFYAELTPENRRRHYLEMISHISRSAKAASKLVTNYKTYPGNIEFSVTANRYAVRDGNYLYFTLPKGLSDILKYRSNKRTLPLFWGDFTNRVIEYNIVLPAGYKPVIMPRGFSWQAPEGAGKINVTVEFNSHTDTIHIAETADLKPALIPAYKFPEIIKAGRTLAHPAMRTILLKKEGS